MPILVPVLIAKVAAWVVALVTSWWAAITTLGATVVVANVTADMIGRVIRIGVVVTILILVVQNLVEIPATSISGLWMTYSATAGPALTMVGYFVPISLVFALLDLYLAACMLFTAIWVVRYIVSVSK